jgi:hypothetical protein
VLRCSHCGRPARRAAACRNAPDCANVLCGDCAARHRFCPACEGHPDFVIASPQDIADRDPEPAE